jgi:type IV pilus assembly protein PilN
MPAGEFARWIDDPGADRRRLAAAARTGANAARQRQHCRRHRRTGGGAIEMRITLNLATRPFADLGPAIKRLRIAMGVLARLSAIGWASACMPSTRRPSSPRPRPLARRQIARIAQERQGYQALMRSRTTPSCCSRPRAQQALRREGFSWTLAMEDLETVLPGGVQVTSLEPERRRTATSRAPARARPPRPRRRPGAQPGALPALPLPRIVGENAEAPRRDPASGCNLSAPPTAWTSICSPITTRPRRRAQASASRKAAAKSEEDKSVRAPRPLHPLPLPAPGQGRPPYAGNPNPANRGPISPGHDSHRGGPDPAPISKPRLFGLPGGPQ